MVLVSQNPQYLLYLVLSTRHSHYQNVFQLSGVSENVDKFDLGKRGRDDRGIFVVLVVQG